MPPRTCLFTIASKNYLAHVRTLLASVAQHHPECARVFVLCDEVDGYFDPAAEDFQTILAKDLEIDRFRHVAFQYSVVELNTAIKPFAVRHLMARYGFERVIYLDPDIRVFGRLEEVLALLDDAEMVLTPHITAPLPQDGCMPDEKVLLQAGSYNLGFAGFRQSPAVDRLLAWWSGHLARECVCSIREGLFVDQRWMDLAPGLVGATALLRHAGYNAAFWNLAHRPISEEAPGSYRAGGVPLAFFHFSGYDPRLPERLSKYSNRFALGSADAALKNLFRDYGQELLRHGFHEVSAWPYAYARFSDGPAIPECCRRYFAKALWDQIPAEQDPFDPHSGSPSVFEQLCQPCSENPWVNGYALAFHQADLEAQLRFPDPLGSHGEPFRNWLLAMHGEFHDPVAAFLAPLRAEPTRPSLLRRGRRLLVRSTREVIRVAEQQALRKLLPWSVRRQVGKWLYSVAWSGGSVERATDHAALHGAVGVNLFDALGTPSTAGEAARRSLQAGAIPVATVAWGNWRLANGEPALPRFRSPAPYAVNLCHVAAEATQEFVGTVGEAVLKGRYSIGSWNWETERFPECWDRAFDFFHELWVPTTFVQQAVGQRAPIPVVVMPESVEVELPPGDFRQRFGIPADRFAVFCQFDATCSMERKNPLGAIGSLKAMASGGRRPFLVLQLDSPHAHPEAVARVRGEIGDLDCRILDGGLSRQETWGVIGACETVLSLHRSEGSGRLLAEAMALGKPVVATGYSGNLDFMGLENSFPVRYDRRALARDLGPYPAGTVWAEPDLRHAAEILCALYDQPALGRGVGERARADVSERRSAAAIGQRMRARLQSLGLVPRAPEGSAIRGETRREDPAVPDAEQACGGNLQHGKDR